MAHAPFAPSAAKRWLNCPGSFALTLTMPRGDGDDGPYAAEGTRLHELAAAYLDIVNANTPVMAAADYAALQPYLDYAMQRIGAARVYAVEERLAFSPLLFGTADLVVEERGMLEVIDLKTGAGIMVDPEENEQLLTYAGLLLGIVQRLAMHEPAAHEIPPVIRLTIVQPPDEDRPVKSWDTTPARVMAHMQRVDATISEALMGGAPLQPGSWCRFCPAKPICPALRGEVVEALAGTLPKTFTPLALAIWLDRAERLELWLKDLRETGHAVATDALAKGVAGIPGWGLKPKRAMRQWADEDKVLAIARRRKIKIWQDKLLSPAMAERAHPNLPAELSEQIVSVSSGTNLVRVELPPATDEAKPEQSAVESVMAQMNLLRLRRL